MKQIVAVLLLLSAIFVFPAWAAKSRPMSDERFLKLSRLGPNRSIIEAINKGANVNARDKYGVTPLMYAAATNRLEPIKALVNAGADVNAADAQNWTVLMYAAADFGDTRQLIEFLIKAGADVNAKDFRGYTVLMWFVGKEVEVDMLLKAGAVITINNQNEEGQTALIHACTENESTSPEVIAILIDAGADVNIEDNYGKRAIDYARENKKLEGTELLKRFEELSK